MVALVFLGNLGGNDNGGNTDQPATIGRDGLRRMLPSRSDLGPEYSAFQLNPDVSGYVSSGGFLGPSCPAPSTTGSATITPLPSPLESYDNQYEFEPSLAIESGTFALVEGVDNFADEDAAAGALDEFIANPVSDLKLGGCPENEIRQSDSFDPAGVGGDATGVEQLIHQTDADDTEREFTVTAVGFTRGTVLGRVLITHFDSPEHQASAAAIAAKMSARIEQVLAEITATPTATPTPSASGSASASGSPSASASASGRTTTPTRTAAPGQAPVIQSLGCSPASVTVGQTVSCSPSISGSVTSRSWSALGGSPASGSGSTFSTSFGSAGSKTLSLQACNGSGCDNASKSISVSAIVTQAPSVPVINSVGCSPTSVQTGQTVSCSPSVSGTVTSRSWSAGGGSPSAGSGSSFSTSFNSSGTKTINFTACNGSLCSSAKATIGVTAPAVGDFTVYTEHVSLFSDETVDVTVFIETPPVGLGEYDIDLIYDPTVIEPLGCTDWLGGDCDEYFDIDTVNSYGDAFQSGNFAIFTVTFGVVGCCYSDLYVSTFYMADGNDKEVFDNLIEIDGSVTVELYIF